MKQSNSFYFDEQNLSSLYKNNTRENDLHCIGDYLLDRLA